MTHKKNQPKAFTLVELLVVIGIIGLLMGIAVPVVLKSLTAARTAAIKTEIDMLHMAIMNYKNEYGAYPPCIDLTVAGDGSGPGVRHMRRLFVRCGNPQQQLAAALPSSLLLTPNNALNVWLSGYTGDATSPVQGERKRLYDFDLLRVNQAKQYAPPRGQGQPYIYLDSSRYSAVDTLAVPGVGQWYVWRNDMTFNPSANPPGSPLISNSGYFNPDTFQIISAGLDGEYFTDDDLSNMWPSTWGDYKKRVAAGVQ